MGNCQKKSCLDVTKRALEESEEWFRSIFHGSREAIFIADENGRFVDVNKAAENLTGYSCQELKNMSIPDLHEPVDLHAYHAFFHRIMAGEPIESCAKILRKDGSKVDTEFNNQRIEVGGVYYMHTVARDISRRRKTEKALRLTQFSIDKATEAIFWIDSDGRFFNVNEAACISLGYSREELLSMVASDINPDCEGDLWAAKWEELRKMGSITVESRHICKNGRIFPIELVAHFVEFEGKEYTCAFVRDISERKQNLANLQRLATAVEQAAEEIMITDLEGKIEYVNPAFEKITGYTRSEVIGKNPRIFQSGRHKREFYRGLWNTIKSGNVWSGRFINKRKDGSIIEEDATISPIYGHGNEIIGYASLKRNVTKQVEMETQLRQAQKMEAVGQLAGGVAHDFNNILQAVLGYTQMSIDDIPPDSPAQADLYEVVKVTGRGRTLVRQLLTFSRREKLQTEDLDLNDLISDLMKMVRRVIGEHIELNIRAAPRLRMIHADPGQIEQILLNLCVNARDAMSGGGMITIETKNIVFDDDYCRAHPWAKKGRYVLLAVGDNGTGISREIMDHIFEPFFTTKEVGEGTGLGLATVYAITERHGGIIRIDSELGKGSRFKIFLPALDWTSTVKKDEQKPLPVAGGAEMILLAEDNLQVRKLTARILKKSGYKVLLARDGQEAIEIFRSQEKEINLALLDVVMPKKGGRAVFDEIKAVNPDVRVLFTTGYSFNTLNPADLPKQRVQIIQKPYTPHDLLKKLREMLD